MASKNVETFKSRDGSLYTSEDLMPVKVAMKKLEIASGGAFTAALKNHPYLGGAIVEKDDTYQRRIARAAVERYEAERGQRGGSRDGAKWFSARLTDAQAADLSRIASERFGVEITFEQPAVRAARIAAAKAAAETNGVESVEDAEDAESVEA
jgi:hypothetical protein